MLILFWCCAALVVYTYALFPALVLLRALLRPRGYQASDITPAVSLVIAARNEEAGIAGKLDNILSLDYPRDRLQVIVASDGSEDATAAIVRRYADRGVTLVDLPRVGKAAALNEAVAKATGEVLVFSDANSMYVGDALRHLVNPLADPAVGGVAGNQCYRRERVGGAAVDGERGYWGFDRWLKQIESRAGSAISATGAIYAMRRSLFREVPPGVTDDFVTSTRVIAQGYRLVFAPQAIAHEPVAGTGGREFSRKVRVITRGLRGIVLMRELLNPARHGFYALQLFSHKLLRRLMVFPLLVLVVLGVLLRDAGWPYRVIAGGQLLFYGCGALGLLLAGTRLGRLRLLGIPAFFLLVNAASLLAVYNVLTGRRIDRWEPQRRQSGPCGAALPAAGETVSA